MSGQIADALIKSGAITYDQLKEALEEQERTGRSLEEVFLSHGFITEFQLAERLGEKYGVRALDLSSIDIDKALISLVPKPLAFENLVIPVAMEDSALVVAMHDPTNLTVLDDLRFATGYEIREAIAGEFALRKAIKKYYGDMPPTPAVETKVQESPVEEDGKIESLDDFDLGEDAEVSTQAPDEEQLSAAAEEAVPDTEKTPLFSEIREPAAGAAGVAGEPPEMLESTPLAMPQTVNHEPLLDIPEDTPPLTFRESKHIPTGRDTEEPTPAEPQDVSPAGEEVQENGAPEEHSFDDLFVDDESEPIEDISPPDEFSEDTPTKEYLSHFKTEEAPAPSAPEPPPSPATAQEGAVEPDLSPPQPKDTGSSGDAQWMFQPPAGAAKGPEEDTARESGLSESVDEDVLQSTPEQAGTRAPEAPPPDPGIEMPPTEPPLTPPVTHATPPAGPDASLEGTGSGTQDLPSEIILLQNDDEKIITPVELYKAAEVPELPADPPPEEPEIDLGPGESLADMEDDAAEVIEEILPGYAVQEGEQEQTPPTQKARRVDPEPYPAAVKEKVVLVVDDSPTVQKIVSLTLEKRGYKVHIAGNALQALAKLNESIPDVILLDINLPHMDGYQVCKIIRSNDLTKKIPIVMLSGKDGFFDKVRGKMAGASDFISKPFQPAHLLEAVGKHSGKGD